MKHEIDITTPVDLPEIWPGSYDLFSWLAYVVTVPNAMSIITITSDWNEDDYYVASLKGKVLSSCLDVRIVDISHRVKPFNTAQAAFLVRNSFRHFPPGSIHIIAVNSEPGADGQLLAAEVEKQYFLCADNGLLGLMGDPAPRTVVSLRLDERQRQSSFVALSVFVAAAEIESSFCRTFLGDRKYGCFLPLVAWTPSINTCRS